MNAGELTAQLIGLPPIPDTPRDEFCRHSWEFISEPHGPARLAAAIAEVVKSAGRDRVLVDGIRQPETLAALRSCLPGREIVVLHIDALPDVAYDFYRSREDNDCTIFDFLRTRQLDVQSRVDEMAPESNAVIYNSKGIERYANAVYEVMQTLGMKKEDQHVGRL